MVNGMNEVETGVNEDVEPETSGKEPGDQVARFRELILKANPDVVPELVRGDSLETLLDSVEPARTAFAGLVERLAKQSARSVVSVPAGGSMAPGIDLDVLPPIEKVRRGLGSNR